MTLTEVITHVIGIIVGFAAAWLFWRWQLIVKPNIEVAPFLTYDPDTERFRIKIINRGRRQVTDIDIRMIVSDSHKVGEHTRTERLHSIPMRKDIPFALGPISSEEQPWNLFPTYIISSEDDTQSLALLRSSSAGERRIELYLSVVDALSGTKVVEYRNYTLEEIKIGRFAPGLNFEVIKPEILDP